MTKMVWQPPTRAVRGWALAAIILLVVAIGLGAAAVGRSAMVSSAYTTATQNEQVAYDAATGAKGTPNEAAAKARLDQAQAKLATAETDLTRSVSEFGALLAAALIIAVLSIAAAVLALILRVRAARARGSVIA
ncbi:MAG: hypothetical protein ABIR17_05320 [Pseudolysinimonas sp.]|uniref:hypothetical protein n=1 Tax=Pseudolysinimonas sp. TaxID=2680009 RepID=UPI003265AC86